MRRLDWTDRLLGEAGRWLAAARPADRADYPAAAAESRLDEGERRQAVACMRVNHAGEVAAQGLYLGQALTARSAATRARMRAAAEAEGAHLRWCERRLAELEARVSWLTPLWYAGAVAIGAAAGAAGDRRSLGFVAETERQVEAHLESHLARLPAADARSRRIVERMRADEAEHRRDALAAGGRPPPAPVPGLMAAMARIMTTTARRL